MRMRDAIKIAKRVARNRASVSPHYGRTRRDRAVRITGCRPDDAGCPGGEIAEATGGHLRESAGFVAVWLD